MKTTLLATVLFLSAVGASGQTINARVELEPRFIPGDRAEPASQLGTEEAPATEAPKAKVRRLIPAERAASINAMEAERRLAQAKLNRQEGMAPLPSELVPGAPGQLSYRYWKRQEKLRLAVELAQRRLNQTQNVQFARR